MKTESRGDGVRTDDRSGMNAPAAPLRWRRGARLAGQSLAALLLVLGAALLVGGRASADTNSNSGNITIDIGATQTITWTIADDGQAPAYCAAGHSFYATFGVGDPGTVSYVDPSGQTRTTGTPYIVASAPCAASGTTLSFQVTGVSVGSASFSLYRANQDAESGNDLQTLSTISVTVRQPNRAPVVSPNPITVTTDEDTAKAVTIPATDADGDTLTYTVATGPSHGTLTGSGATRNYMPDANYNGSDTFTVTVADGKGGSTTATVNVTVNSVNDPPVFADGDSVTLTVPENGVHMISIPATDVDGDTLVYGFATTSSRFASVSINGAAQTTTYQLFPGYYGPDQCAVRASDGKGGSDTITINVTVVLGEHAPVASDGSLTTDEDTAASGTLSATDVNSGDTLTYAATQPAHGRVTVNAATGDYTYTPSTDFNGTDSFTFTASDGQQTSNAATVIVTVNAVNDAPVAANQAVATDEDNAVTITPTGSDVDNDALTYTIASQPTNGSARDNGDGTFTYQPSLDFHGDDSFTITASDGDLSSAPATISVTVTPVNDAPVATDVDNDPLTYRPATGPDDGSLTVSGDGTYIYPGR